jgi:NAD+-dependent protein deacetylase SIR2
VARFHNPSLLAMPTVAEDPTPAAAADSAAPLDHPARDDPSEPPPHDGDDDLDSISDESLYEDILETSASDYKYGAGKWESLCTPVASCVELTCLLVSTDNRCTKEESERLRTRLREVGIEKFVDETIHAEIYTPLKLLSAFRVAVPPIFAADEKGIYELLGLALYRELSARRRLPQYRTIDDAAKLLSASKNILVITGAGVRFYCFHLMLNLVLTGTDFYQPRNSGLSVQGHGLLYQAQEHGFTRPRVSV